MIHFLSAINPIKVFAVAPIENEYFTGLIAVKGNLLLIASFPGGLVRTGNLLRFADV
jgi:hypothetical protein